MEVHRLVVGEWVDIQVEFISVEVFVRFFEFGVEELDEDAGIGDDF